MNCIWKGDLRNVWDTVQLCRIIENLEHWTIRHFRPWVSSCLDIWRLEIKVEHEQDEKSVDELEGDEESVDEHEVNQKAVGEFEELKYDATSEEDLISTDEEYDLDTEGETEGEDEEDECSIEECKHFKQDSSNEEFLTSEVGDNQEESDEESEAFQVPSIRLDLFAKTGPKSIANIKRIGAHSLKSSPSTPGRRGRNASTLSPEALTRNRAPLHHGETSPIPLRTEYCRTHLRSRSTG